MKQFTIPFCLSDLEGQQLDRVTELFNSLYANEQEAPQSQEQLFGTIARTGARDALQKWLEILEAKARQREGGQHEPDT